VATEDSADNGRSGSSCASGRTARDARLGFALCAFDSLNNHLLGIGRVVPPADLDPLAGFEILIVLEEMRHLVERDFRQVGVVEHIFVAPGDMRRGHGKHLLVHAGIVLHQKHPDWPHINDATRQQLARVANQHVDGVAIAGKRMRHEAVIPGITHGGVEKADDEQRARFLVHLTFERLAADAHFNADVEVFGRIFPDGYGVYAHGEPFLRPPDKRADTANQCGEKDYFSRLSDYSQTKATFFSALFSNTSTPSAMSRPPAPA